MGETAELLAKKGAGGGLEKVPGCDIMMYTHTHTSEGSWPQRPSLCIVLLARRLLTLYI